MRNYFILLLALLFMFAGCTKDETSNKNIKKRAIIVKVKKVERGTLSKSLNYKGSVYPWKKANILPDTVGRILKIYKKPGDIVKKGDLLAELDTTTLKLRLKQANAAMEVSNALYKDALLNFSRLKELYAQQAVSKIRLEKTKLGLESALTQKKNASANVDVINHTLKKSYMRAPFKGIITSKNMEEGDIINPNMGRSAGVLTLMNIDKVKIILDIPSFEIDKIEIGQDCKIQLNSDKTHLYNGKVYLKNLAAEYSSKTFKVDIVVDNPDMKIKAGILADVNIEITRKENVLYLPLAALIKNDKIFSVVLYNDGRAKNKIIKSGLTNKYNFEITEGLSEGQIVVIDGNYDLKENSEISYEGAIK